MTAVELMPVTEFEECDNPRTNLLTGEPLRNFWGYQPVSFFAPKASYAANGAPAEAVREFKSMVKALHEAGIEVILDIVFNHTGEGDERGATFCWRGLDNPTYYLLEPKTGRYLNYSGCGNTLNCNHPVVRFQILAALRYWVTEMHVDGFRFDLASILGRGRDGEVLPNPPLLEAIAGRPGDGRREAHRRGVGRGRALPGGQLPELGPLGGVERPVPRRGAPLREERPRHDAAPRHAALRQPRPLPGAGPRALALDQLPDQPRRLHPRRPRLLQRQAQLGERRGQHRRPRRQPLLELRRGGAVVEPRGDRAPRGGSSGTSWPSSSSRRASPCSSPGTSSAARSAATTTPTARTTTTSWVDWSLLETERRPLPLHAAAHPLPQGAPRRCGAGRSSRTRRSRPSPGTGRSSASPTGPASRGRSACTSSGAGGDEPIYLIANAHWEAKAFELPKLAAGMSWRRFLDTSLPPGEDALEPGAEVAGPAGPLRGGAPVGRGAGRALVGR